MHHSPRHAGSLLVALTAAILLSTLVAPAALGRVGTVDGAYLLAAAGAVAGSSGAAGGPATAAGSHEATGPSVAADAGPLGAVATPPLPRCEYRDELTRYHERYQWRITLVDTILRLRRSYAPTDLVPVSRAKVPGTGSVRQVMIADLRAMAAAARAAGPSRAIAVRSAYRSYGDQVATFNGWVDQQGYDRALLFAARPGHSEHQLGTTIDVRSASSASAPWTYDDWGETPAGRWMKANAWRYGFVMSYPKGMRRETCYGYEPWHWRYVGRDTARAVHESGLTLRRFLWERYETAP